MLDDLADLFAELRTWRGVEEREPGVLCLWDNAGRRELGLEDYDGRWSPPYRFAFVRSEPPG
jgi:hypothetical protein